MAKIKQLPQTVANQISAGEVVERPASVVKELIENAIDAESKQIFIDIENGGKDKIRIKDNGTGIEPDELPLAFSRYATSKINQINDLYSIHTLGFRGEALASIASVSKVEISSRTADHLKGAYLKLEGGEIILSKPVGVPVGTDITITDLFYNTPARFKYLKTTNTEFGHISNIINREALAYPGIKITLEHNGHQVIKTPGTNNLLDTIYAIYGDELVSNLVEIEYEDRYIKLNGYIARPNYYRSSRVYQLYFVNQRSVHNRVLYQGVEEGYRGLLPPNTYPVVFLNIHLNQILVDVNVHPTKREVKFSRDAIIQDVIKKGVRATLKKIDVAPKFKFKKNKQPENKKEKKATQLPLNSSDNYNIDNDNTIEQRYSKNNHKIKEENEQFSVDKETSLPEKKVEKEKQQKYDFNRNNKRNKEQDQIKEDNLKPKEQIKINHNDNQQISDEQTKPEPGLSSTPVKRILGQIQQTYIIAEVNDGLYLIDQHNAHERVLYEQFQNKYERNQLLSQPLLVPITLEITLPELEIIKKYREELTKLGLKIDSFGGKSLLIQEVPFIIKKRATKEVIRELIDNLLKEGKTIKRAKLIDNIITYMSCRGAIKAGMQMAEQEIEKLITDLFQSSNPNRCPHGRPIIIHLSTEDIEKGMGRR